MTRDHTTADGVQVGRGDTAWRVLSYGMPRQVKLNKAHLYWMRLDAGTYFSTEQAALEYAIATTRKALKRVQTDLKRESKRLKALWARQVP